MAKAGIYSFVLTARGKSSITLGVGFQEIPGEVVRGPYVAPTPIPTASATPTPVATPTVTATPTPTRVSSTPYSEHRRQHQSATTAGYTMAQVRANNTARELLDSNRWMLCMT